MQNFAHQFIEHFQNYQKEQLEKEELLYQLFKEYPMYCILVFLILNIISFYIKNINIDFTDFRTVVLFLLIVSMFGDVINIISDIM
jgi:hypothetical protein